MFWLGFRRFVLFTVQDAMANAAGMMAMSMQIHAEAMEAQRVARNYAKAAKRSWQKVESMKED